MHNLNNNRHAHLTNLHPVQLMFNPDHKHKHKRETKGIGVSVFPASFLTECLNKKNK